MCLCLVERVVRGVRVLYAACLSAALHSGLWHSARALEALGAHVLPDAAATRHELRATAL